MTEINKEYLDAKYQEDVISESNLIEWVGLSKATLNALRYSGKLPYTYLSKTCRLYFMADVLNLLKENRRQIDQ